MEGNSLMNTHKEIFIKMVASKKKGPWLSEYFYSLFGTCVKSKKRGHWNLKMGSLKSPWILQQKKCTNPESNYTYIETFNEIHFKMAWTILVWFSFPFVS